MEETRIGGPYAARGLRGRKDGAELTLRPNVDDYGQRARFFADPKPNQKR